MHQVVAYKKVKIMENFKTAMQKIGRVRLRGVQLW